jgi:5-methylcytosine-specific restriction endonuclease McrA
MTDAKKCSRCGTVKARSEFGRTKANKDGLAGQCRSCRTEIQRDRRQSDPDYAERQRQTVRSRRATGRRAPSEALRPQREPSQEEQAARAQRRSYYLRIAAANAQARRFGAAVNDFTLAEWYEVIDEHDGCCFYCVARTPLWIEHVVPFAKGGDNTRSNVVPSCEMCNRKKSKRSAEQFRANLCHQGHPLSGDNIYVYPNGKKTVCKTCRRESFRRYRAKKKASV